MWLDQNCNNYTIITSTPPEACVLLQNLILVSHPHTQLANSRADPPTLAFQCSMADPISFVSGGLLA